MSRGKIAKGALLSESFLVYLFLYAPIIILVIFSFNSSRYAIWEGFSLQWYVKAIQDELILRSIKNSLIVAVISTIISTVIGTLAALGMQRFQFKIKNAADGLFYLPVIIPEIVMAAALVTFLEEAAMDLGANEFQTFFKVTLPVIAPGILSGALLAFTLSVDDYVITSFVAGVGSTTLPLQKSMQSPLCF
jgi:spermidine/putrescine transport system permease protein